MSLILGTGALFAAFVLICLGRVVLSRGAAGQGRFGPTEAVAYLFTLLVAAGIALLANAAVQGSMPEVLAQIGVALAVLAATCTATLVALRPLLRTAPAGDGAPAEAAPHRAARRAPSNAPSKPAGGGRRRAA